MTHDDAQYDTEKVLVVDDKAINRESARMLEDEGYKVDTASTLNEGIEALGREKFEGGKDPDEAAYDAVLTDLMMPLGEGGAGGPSRHTADYGTGFAMALYAAKVGVDHVGIYTDLNHHDNPLGAAFDLFEGKDENSDGPFASYGRDRMTINDSEFMLFDERDHPKLYKRGDGGFDTQEEYREAGLEVETQSEWEEMYLHRNGEPVTAKNWVSALNELLA